MRGNRPSSWSEILKPAGIYAIFLLQFLIPAQVSLSFIARSLKSFGINIDGMPESNKSLFVALVFFVPFVLIVWALERFFRSFYERLTILNRVSEFDATLGAIANYHGDHPIEKIVGALSNRTTEDSESGINIADIMIDLLITDLRDAFQDLCQWPDIRVAVYAESKERVAYNRPEETVLHMIASTEFGKHYELSTQFRKVNTTGKYQGYCGRAWDSGRPTCGTNRRFLFWRDSTFFCGNVLDKSRSFLCLPIAISDTEGEPVVAVLSIDSGRRYDLLLGRDLLQTIHIKTTVIRAILVRYLRYRI